MYLLKKSSILRKATKNLENQLQCRHSSEFPRHSQHWVLPWILDVQRYYFPSHHSTISIGEKLVPIPRYHSPPHFQQCNLRKAKLCRWEIATLGMQLYHLGIDCSQCSWQGHLRCWILRSISNAH